MQDPELSSYCPHVTFVYLPDYDFEYVHPDFENMVADVQRLAEESDESRVEDLLLALPQSDTSFIIEVRSAGMNCGLSSFRVFYGFDLSARGHG
jgi:hypothetical protein